MCSANVSYARNAPFPGDIVTFMYPFVNKHVLLSSVYHSSCCYPGLVAVHCTHGLNRTGYLVCRYTLSLLYPHVSLPPLLPLLYPSLSAFGMLYTVGLDGIVHIYIGLKIVMINNIFTTSVGRVDLQNMSQHVHFVQPYILTRIGTV